MPVLKRLNSLTNIGLRGSSLVFRFVLTFYIAKYLGYEETGLYGLTLGVIGITPALIGWGLNYFTSRDIIGIEPLPAASRIKTRLAVTTVSLAAISGLTLVGVIALGYDFRWIFALILVLVWLESYAVDIHVALIAVEMPVQANVLVFIRLALWVPFVIGLGLWLPALRTLEFVLVCWIGTYVVFFACLAFFLRRWPLKEAAKAPLEREWIAQKLRGSWFIYLSDIGMVGMIYIDRYIVSFMLGLTLTGIYTFYWSLTNALQTLIATAVVQLTIPMFYKAYVDNDPVRWSSMMRLQLLKITSLATVMAGGVFVVAEIAIRYMSMPELAEYRVVFIMMLLASILRSCSDLFNAGLASMKRDRHYAIFNLCGIAVSTIVAFAMIYAFGFLGVGVSAVVSASILAMMRGIWLRKAYRDFADTSRVLMRDQS